MSLPSRTSILVAAARAFASREPDESLRNPDFLADKLVGEEELALISHHPISQALRQNYADSSDNTEVVLFAWLMLMRTRFIDEALKRAVANGIRQVVILGAGLDSRAYRFQDLLQNCRVVEIDKAATQEYKRRRLTAIACPVPPNVTYHTIDFVNQSLQEILTGAGISKSEQTFYIWEGVCMYVPEQGVRETLRTVATNSSPGSSLVMDYANQLWLEQLGTVSMFASWGEPWIFGVPNPDGKEFFRELGLDPGNPLAVSNMELIKKYTMNAHGKIYGAQVFEKLRSQRPPGQSNTRPETYWLTELTVI